jgi:hypothetical protein
MTACSCQDCIWLPQDDRKEADLRLHVLYQQQLTASTIYAGSRPAANGVFIVTIPKITFSNSTAINLSGVPNVTQWVQYTPKPAAGSFAKVTFAPHPPFCTTSALTFAAIQQNGHSLDLPILALQVCNLHT